MLARPFSSVCSDENRLFLWGEAEYHIYRMGVLDMKATSEGRRLRTLGVLEHLSGAKLLRG